MKRKFLLAAALALALCLSSCGGTLTPSQVTPETGDNGIVLKTQFPVYAPDVGFIQFTIENNSGDTAEYGTQWSLERYRNDGWYTVPFAPDTGWTLPLIMLPDGGVSSDTAYLSMLDHKLKDGRYRIVKEINDTFYTAEFTVGDSRIRAESPYGYAPLESLPSPYTMEMVLADGVMINNGTGDFTPFFDNMNARMNTQIRWIDTADENTGKLTDITAEFLLGQTRIRYRTEDIDRYYAYFVTDGTRIALSSAPIWDAAGADMQIIDSLSGNTSVLRVLEQTDSDALADFCRAAVWSADGTRLLSLPPDTRSPLEFWISVCYPDGGSAGHTVMLDTPGMKAIRSARWTDENSVMLICDVQDIGLSNMTGYVFYDTEEDRVLSYTQSQYEPITDENGNVLIPE